MTPRQDYKTVAPQAYAAMLGVESYVKNSGLEKSLLELVRTRASQINGCAHCLDMHTKDARAAGEPEQRLYTLPAWRETPFFTDRERAALEWTEAVTLISAEHISNALYDRIRQYFSGEEIIDLTMAVVSINGWNRLAIAFQTVPGTYKPSQKRADIP
jgi:AhpD family alkylhydroperoxidase